MIIFYDFVQKIPFSLSEARWCTVNNDELEKCGYLRNSIEERHNADKTYPPGFKTYLELPELMCVEGRDR